MFGSLPVTARERRRLTVIKLTGLVVFAAPLGVWVYMHHQSERVAIEATANKVEAMTTQMAPDQLRRHLAEKFGTFVALSLPQSSGVKATIEGSDGKYSLSAEHPRFNQRSYSVGPLAPNLKQWTAKNRDELKRAGIVKVRVGPYAFATGAQARTARR